ncbi:MAG: amino acid ABC transporter permease [Chloroflexota bacterium]|nr:amino acid ABC transporter permease [Chloroflexota bacterium]MDQ5867664.1 amino acid ABC transporter permease [Chloroflexota bacterium]
MAVQAQEVRAARPGFNWWPVLRVLLQLVGVGLFLVLIPIAFGMEWRNFERIFTKATSLRFLSLGLVATVAVSLIAILLSLPLATGLALGRLSRIRWIKLPCVAFIEVIRALPLLLLIFYINLRFPGLNFLAPLLGEPTTEYFGRAMQIIFGEKGIAVIIALTLYTAAVNAELLRSGILSLDRGQNEAARSLGLSYWQSMRKVILPQAYRRTLAPLIAQFTILVKDTSLGSIIGFIELQRTARIIYENDYNPLEALYVVAILYFIVNYLLGLTSKFIERRRPSVQLKPIETG